MDASILELKNIRGQNVGNLEEFCLGVVLMPGLNLVVVLFNRIGGNKCLYPLLSLVNLLQMDVFILELVGMYGRNVGNLEGFCLRI
jgi:hypothetical protein